MSEKMITVLPQATIQSFPNCLSSKLKPVKPISVLHIPTPNSVSSTGFVSNRAISRETKAWSPYTTMSKILSSTKICASKGGDGDEGVVEAFEQEALLDASSDFRARFMAEGLNVTLNRESKWILAVVFAAIIVCRHDAEAVWFVAGSAINVFVSIYLKRILNHERPVSNLRSDPGMPSSHAQCLFFTFTFPIISYLKWLGINKFTLLTSGSALAFASYLSWLRVSQQLHTVKQVVAGAVFGFVLAILWYWSWSAVVMKAFVSFLWVRVLVILGAIGLLLGFVIYIYKHRHRHEV